MSVSSDNADFGLPPSYVLPDDLRERTWVRPKVVPFPNPRAGKPVHSANSTNNAYATLLGNNSDSNPFHPFASKLDWEVAKWAKLQGPSSSSLKDLLKIEGVKWFTPMVARQVSDSIPLQVHEMLGLSYETPRQLNRTIDSLPGQGEFKREEVVMAGEAFDVYYRDILTCIEDLFGKPEFASSMKFAPERHYADEDQTVRIYCDIHTGRWWWATQVGFRCSIRICP